MSLTRLGEILICEFLSLQHVYSIMLIAVNKFAENQRISFSDYRNLTERQQIKVMTKNLENDQHVLTSKWRGRGRCIMSNDSTMSY